MLLSMFCFRFRGYSSVLLGKSGQEIFKEVIDPEMNANLAYSDYDLPVMLEASQKKPSPTKKPLYSPPQPKSQPAKEQPKEEPKENLRGTAPFCPQISCPQNPHTN